MALKNSNCPRLLPYHSTCLAPPAEAAATTGFAQARSTPHARHYSQHRLGNKKTGKPYEFSWTLFWSEGLGSRFGHYGFFGNNFGESQPIEVMGHVYRFPHKVFYAYKLARANQAISATAETLHWYRTLEK